MKPQLRLCLIRCLQAEKEFGPLAKGIVIDGSYFHPMDKQ
jgi:hypothetical protein